MTNSFSFGVAFIGRVELARAIRMVRHPVVRHCLEANAWKIKTWADFAEWKKVGRGMIPRAWNHWYGLKGYGRLAGTPTGIFLEG